MEESKSSASPYGYDPEWGWRDVLAALMALGVFGFVAWFTLTLFLRSYVVLALVLTLALPTLIAYWVFRLLHWANRRYPNPAVASIGALLVLLWTLWPMRCSTYGGKLGAPTYHYCDCAGLELTSSQHPGANDAGATVYCLGLESGGPWVETPNMELLQ